ncbi:hypothetical protein HLB25_10305 [Dickeya dadantii]|uniref:hypothetical protein n=1 Tax=Dickeya dadantii TaxID=204038 RepID=UPI0014957F2D|nr:hypothetical protein [Dickeya dadantii]NPE55901.1 hypothetical protein [Dickeya dadantii]NPE67125.1 hypothetical protein [Dickeya dadantii]
MNNRVKISPRVVISTSHPVAGRLYLEMISERDVGLPDVYLITDELWRAETYKKGWREEYIHLYPYKVEKHLAAVDANCICRIAEKYGIAESELWSLCRNIACWNDLSVVTEYNETMGEWIAINLSS